MTSISIFTISAPQEIRGNSMPLCFLTWELPSWIMSSLSIRVKTIHIHFSNVECFSNNKWSSPSLPSYHPINEPVKVWIHRVQSSYELFRGKLTTTLVDGSSDFSYLLKNLRIKLYVNFWNYFIWGILSAS